MNKKASAEALWGIAILLAALLIVSSPLQAMTKNFAIGNNQYALLQANEETQLAHSYIQKSFSFAASHAVTQLITHKGYFIDQQQSSTDSPYPCAEHLWPVYSATGKNCLPAFSENYQFYLRKNLENYFRLFSLAPLQFGYQLLLTEQTPGKLSVQLASTTDLHIPIASEDLQEEKKTNNRQTTYPSGLLGGYGTEEPIICSTGDCFAQVSEYLFTQYTRNGPLSFVDQGSSPYTYADAKRIQDSAQKTIFSSVTLYEKEPATGDLTRSGFDSAGWIWWSAVHASIPALQGRKTVQEYFDESTSYSLICDEQRPCLRKTILDSARPGDILFYGTTKNPTAMILYLGQGQVLESHPATGLTKKDLTQNYAAQTTTNILRVVRYPYSAGGYQTLKEYQDSHTQPTQLIGAESLCIGEDYSYSKLHLLQTESPFAPGVTYEEIIIAAGLQQGIDPAFISFHAAVESQIGTTTGYKSCVDVGSVSKFTGYGWESDEKNYFCKNTACTCREPVASSDAVQAQNTAKLYVRAIQEALTGDASLAAGAYELCHAYEPYSQEMWGCIICLYGNQYDQFKQTKTCTYMDLFKPIYCPMREHFAALGYESNISLSDLNDIVAKNYLSSQPQAQTTVDLSLQELNQLADFIKNIINDCTDHLAVCVQNHIETFNKNHKTVQLSQTAPVHALAYDIVDQVVDCRHNTQENCLCLIQPKRSLYTESYTDYIIRFSADGTVFAGKNYFDDWYDVGSGSNAITEDTKVTLLKTPESYVASTIQDTHTYVDLVFDFEDNKIKMELEDQGDDYTWERNANHFILGKYPDTKKDVTVWSNYNKKEYGNLACHDQKHYFPIYARISSLDDFLPFTIYLEDTTPPPPLTYQLERTSFTPPQLLFSWIVPHTTEPLYSFEIHLEEQTTTIGPAFAMNWQVTLASAKPLDRLDFVPKAFTLYEDVGVDSTTYYYLVTESTGVDLSNTVLFNPGTTYAYTVLAVDNYLNKGPLDLSQTITIPEENS